MSTTSPVGLIHWKLRRKRGRIRRVTKQFKNMISPLNSHFVFRFFDKQFDSSRIDLIPLDSQRPGVDSRRRQDIRTFCEPSNVFFTLCLNKKNISHFYKNNDTIPSTGVTRVCSKAKNWHSINLNIKNKYFFFYV